MPDSPEFVKDEKQLRCEFAAPSELVIRKCLSQLDQHFRQFIAHSPFLCLASADENGAADVSPRGDAPGFVCVIDDKHVLIPDRVGNNRLDSLSNITRNPNVGLIFFIPGVDETLRVNGQARVVRNWQALSELEANGKAPHTGLLVEVAEAYFQCGKALKRAKLWSDSNRIERSQLSSFGQALVDQTQSTMTAQELNEYIDQSYRERLY